jgi:hypothetical protein
VRPKVLKLFADRSHYDPRHRSELMPILRPFWKDQQEFSDEARAAVYGDWVRHVMLTKTTVEADLAVLPMSWNFYVLNGRDQDAVTFVQNAKNAGLEVLTWCSGDFGVKPLTKDVYLFCSCGYHSKRLPRQFAFPVFFSDPLLEFFGTREPVIRPRPAVPVVGFCGQAYAPWYKSAFDILRTSARNLSYHLGFSPFQPQHIYPSTLRRKEVLSILGQAKGLKTRFVIRKDYRAGAKSMAEKEQTSREYFQNMIDSDYIVCLRGNGNFSKRLYETLSMGRIPVIIDTDCVYPLNDRINWDKIGVWIRSNELRRLPEKIRLYHESLDEQSFIQHQYELRRIWNDNLTMNGFFSVLLDGFRKPGAWRS